MQFALKNRMPVATSASTQASRVIAPATVTRMSVSTRARSMLFPRLASSQGARTIVAQASPRDVSVDATKSEVKGQSSRLTIKKGDPSNFALGILGDLHMDPRDLAHSFEGREHVKAALATEENTFVVSLGDVGESKDCTQTKQLYAGTSECFKLVREYLDGFGQPYNVVGGNHDLEGIDEFKTDKENLEAYLRILGKDTPQFAYEVAPKVLLIGLGSTCFRDAPYTSHEVACDAEQIDWFEKTVRAHSYEDGWTIFCFSHAPIIGSGLRVLQECHVVNGCCWLNHNDPVASKRFINTVRANPQVKAWFSGHFHLSHDYEDSITFPGGNNRGSCIFAQTGVMTARSSRDGRRHTRFLRGNSEGFEVCTIDHAKGGVVRLDATVLYSDECEFNPDAPEGTSVACSVMTYAHAHEDYDHALWFSAYLPKDGDGCYIENPRGVIDRDFSSLDPVAWWQMKDGKILGGHNGMIIEYDPSTLAPLGMVVSRDELMNRKVAVIDDGWGGDALVLFDEDTSEATVVQPNEDGSYWRKVVRNKMHRMREMRRASAAKKWLKAQKSLPEDAEVDILSSWGPYITTAGNVMGITTKPINVKAAVSGRKVEDKKVMV